MTPLFDPAAFLWLLLLLLGGVGLARRPRWLGMALILVATGWWLPGLYRAWLESWGMDTFPVLDLGSCANTREEALRTAELAAEHGWTRILLVTSASHLRRSEGAFGKVGLGVEPVGCDFLGTASKDRKRNWFPQSGSLVMLQLWLREVVGYPYYRMRGWI